MPLWVFTHTQNTFSAAEKSELAKLITVLYVKVHIPAFFVNVQFLELAPTDIYVGGEGRSEASKYAAISIYHPARAFDNDASKKKFLDKVDSILTPRLGEKGADWEYFIQETPRDLWRVNGMVPPAPGSEFEKEWLRLNKPVVAQESF
jgi:phenylpyruvate tautomerase PptA (4-oxalocrotonate tautomerase family)